jgi:outer membrane lipoprotein-sorting protein
MSNQRTVAIRKTIDRRLVTQTVAMGLFAALLLSSPLALAKKTGDELIKCFDNKANNAKDQHFVYEMRIHEPKKKPRTMHMKVWITGEMRLVHFTNPGDVKGMKVLIRSRKQMYVYMPSFRKIRRIHSHMKAQTLLGADFNYDDQSTVFYGKVYSGKLLGETKTHYKVRANPRSGSDTPYGHLVLMLRKKDCLPDKILLHNRSGKHIKTETRTDYSCQGDICNARVMKMVDHTRNDHFTEIVRTKWKTNTGVSWRKFTRRALQRSH